MTRCQVARCQATATVRGKTGYALCARHRDHTRPLRSSYFTGTREEALADFWATHRVRDVVRRSVQVRQARGSNRTWYVTYQPTRALLRRAGLLPADPSSGEGREAPVTPSLSDALK